MLHEIPHLRQSNRSHIKRWFTSQDMDLFVWFHKNVPVRFQLSYNKPDREKSICWDFHRGFHHYLVDSGETFPDQYKQTPLLISLCNQRDLTTIARNFLAGSEKIDIGLSDFIYARLMEYPAIPVRYGATHTDRPVAT